MYKKLLSDFSPGVNLSITSLELGLDRSNTPWASGINVELYSQKGVCRQSGNTLLTTNPADKEINSLFYFNPETAEFNKKILYSTTDGCFYEYDLTTNTHTCLKNDLTSGKPCIYTRYLDGVAVANGADEPFFYHITGQNAAPALESTDTVAKDGESKIIARALCSYKGRLWLSDGDTIYYSALGTYDDWQTAYDAGFIANFHCDSAPVTALLPYKDYIAIYKSAQTYLLTGSSHEDFAIVPFTDKGACSQNAVVTANNRQFFFSKALLCLEQTGLLAQITLGQEASLNIKPVLNGTSASLKTVTAGGETFHIGAPLDKSRLNMLHAVVCEPKNQLRFFVPTENNPYINNIWIYDWVNSAWSLRALPQPVLCAANYEDNIIIGTKDGKILVEDHGQTFDGEPIFFEWKSPFLTLGNPNSRKIIDDFYLLISDNVDNNFIFSTYRDYDTLDSQDHENILVSNLINLIWGSDSSDGGNFLWADDNSGENEIYTQRWAVPSETAQKTNVSGSCISVQFCIEGNQPEHNFALLGLEYKEITAD